MSTQLKLRRGTTTQHSTFTGAEGEITVDTTKDTIVVHDGATAGGFPLAKESTVTALDSAAVHKTGDETVSGTKTFSSNPVYSAGTANGVAYLNGSKILTTGSALTFDGSSAVTLLTAGGTPYMSFSRGGGAYLNVGQDATGPFYNSAGSNNHRWLIDAGVTEAMRLTSTGLGIGTSSPSDRLSLAGSSVNGVGISVSNASNGAYSTLQVNGSTGSGVTGWANSTVFEAVGSGGMVLGAYSGSIKFQTNARSSSMTLDSSGKLGLGVTPSAWSNLKAIDIVGGSAIAGFGNTAYVTSNAYFNGSAWTYKASSYATLYEAGLGAHLWKTAPSGTAGNAISFTQAMTLDASGNLAIGTSSPSYRLDVVGSSTVGSGAVIRASRTNAGASLIVEQTNGTNSASIQLQNTNATGSFQIGTLGSSNAGIFFYDGVNNAERMRITSGGEVYIAGTTDQGAYNLQCNGTGVWGAGAYVNGSDARLKENVTTLDNSLGLINAMRPVTFTYKEDYSKDRSVQTGFIAQELQEVLAGKDYLDGIVQAGPEHLNVAYQNLIPLLVKAVQELTARVAQLEGN